MDDSLRDIRQRLLKRKNELNLSYQDMSDKTGLSKSTLQRYITGDIGNLGLDKVELLAKALDVTPAYLMGWEEDTTEPEEETPDKVKVLAREAGDLSDVQIDLLRSMIQQFKEGKR